jgi:tRNA A-37 threonylcarbamoyl transferase component Bud32
VAQGPVQTLTASPSGLPRTEPARDDFAPLAPGSLIEHYEVIELLGEGSMGAVYRARDLDLGREVALKRIKPDRVDLQRAQARLHREAQVMARIEHAAVVRVYEVGIADGQLFIAMELARGGSVAAWAKASRRSWRDVVGVFIDAGRGLAAAHRAGIVHRDIKPGNLLLDAHGRAKISDFGVARVLGDDRGDDDDDALPISELSVTHTGAVIGTLAYMPPEQLAGEPIDPRADQFAFCVALWSLLCGQWPFARPPGSEAEGSPEQFHRVITAGQLEPVRDRRAPRRILALIRRGLAADRAARWASMDDLLDALERAARPRRGWWLAAAGVSVVIAGALASGMRADEPNAPVAPATCGARDQLAGVWTAAARTTYVAAGRDAEFARQDAAWFDDYAAELAHAYGEACGHAMPAVIECLDEAVGDLRTAIYRHERAYWPRLRALDRCGSRWHERDAGALFNGETGRSSPDGTQILHQLEDKPPTIRDLKGQTQWAVELAFSVRWLDDGSIVGAAENGDLAVATPGRPGARRLAARRVGVLDVSPDLTTVATRSFPDLRVELSPVAGGAPVVPPIRSVFGPGGTFSPDNQRFALSYFTTMPMLAVDELRSRQRTTIPLRVHRMGTGFANACWIDDHQLLVNGSATADVASDVWRLRVDRGGHLIGPPEIWVAGEHDTMLDIDDVHGARMLISRSRASSRNFLVDDTAPVGLPNPGEPLYPINRAGDRVLVATNLGRTRTAWMSLDGTQVTPLPALDDLEQVAVAPHGVVAIDERGERPSVVAFDDRGGERARLALPWPWARARSPTLRCGRARCVVMSSDEHDADIAVIEDDRDGRPRLGRQTHTTALGYVRRFSWDVSPDGNWIAAPKLFSATINLYDVEHGVVRSVTCARCQSIQGVRFLANGGLLMFSSMRDKTGIDPFSLMRREPDGREKEVWRGEQWVPSFLPIDEHRISINTLSYDSRLILFEP